MKKQNVLIVHNYYRIPGGEDTVVSNEKKLLEEHGHRVTLYSRNNSELDQMSFLRKLLLPVTTVFNFRTYRDIRRILRDQKIEIVHVHNTLNLISPAVYYAAVKSGIPVVQTIHNFRLLCPGAMFFRDGQICQDCVSHGLWCAVRHGCYRGSRIQTLACVISTVVHRTMGIYGKLNYICLTEFNREKLLELKQIPGERVRIKPNFVESANDFVPEKERENQFVYVGRLDQSKGVELLFTAWKQMGEHAPRLVVCGTGPMEDWCKDFVAGNKVNIELRGFVPNAEARKLMAISRALILPTQLYEGFPMSIVEAFSVGTPVLCSDLGNAGSMVVDGVTGRRFQPDSPESLLHAVSCCDGMVENTWNEYRMRYTSESNYRTLIDIYTQATV